MAAKRRKRQPSAEEMLRWLLRRANTVGLLTPLGTRKDVADLMRACGWKGAEAKGVSRG